MAKAKSDTETQSPAPGEDLVVRFNDSPSVRSLKENATNLMAHIEKREELLKGASSEEAVGHQQTLAEEKARLADLRKALK